MIEGIRNSRAARRQPDQAIARLRPRPAAGDQADRPQAIPRRHHDPGPALASLRHRGGHGNVGPIVERRRRCRRARAGFAQPRFQQPRRDARGRLPEVQRKQPASFGAPEGLRGEHVALKVSDTGTGMDEDTMERVFEPFFTTKSFGHGTGLGLSQVFGSPSRSAARSPSNPRLGKGSTFTLYLPASRVPDASLTKANGTQARGRVLVVEDDELVAELAAGLLSELGFEPNVVHSAREALDRLAGGDKPKLIFSDIVMPGGISGIELAQKVRGRFPELPILLTTGYSEEVGGTHGFPVLQKPYELEFARRSAAKDAQAGRAGALACFRPTKRRSVGCGKRPVACNGGGNATSGCRADTRAFVDRRDRLAAVECLGCYQYLMTELENRRSGTNMPRSIPNPCWHVSTACRSTH